MGERMIEQWQEFANGYYEVSDLGNVRRAKPGIATFVGRPVMPVSSGNGYSSVAYSDGSRKQKRAYVHHIVALAFLGERPAGFVVNHKDGNKQNNSCSNLEYVSRKENAQHAIKNLPRRAGPKKPKAPLKGRPAGDVHWTKQRPDRIARGSRMPHAKLTGEIVIDIRRRASAGEKQIELAKQHGISIAQISRIVRGQRWSYLHG